MKLIRPALTGVLLLAVSACAGAATQSRSAPVGPPSAAVSSAAAAIGVTERDFRFDTPDVAIHGAASLVVTNAGPTVHDLSIRNAAGTVLAETDDLKAGASATLDVDLPAGTYTMFCALPGHESLGLKGTLTVTR